MDFPTLYIYLNEVDDTKADEYVRLLQMIANVLSKNQDGISNEKDPRIDILLTDPQAFLHSEDDINESQHIKIIEKFNMLKKRVTGTIQIIIS